MLTLDELRNFLIIDQNNLDQACSEQPELFGEACDLFADAKEEADIADLEYDRIKAEVTVGYKTGTLPAPEKASLTDPLVASLALKDPKVIAAKTKSIGLKKKLLKYEGSKNAFDHRRSMLSNLVTLHQSQYFHNSDIKPRSQPIDRDKAEDAIIRARRGLTNGGQESN